MLEQLFGAILTTPIQPHSFTEQIVELKEMKAAIRRANMAKAADEIGLTAEQFFFFLRSFFPQ